MPSHHSQLFAKGVKKPHIASAASAASAAAAAAAASASSSYKNLFHVFQKKNHHPVIPMKSMFCGFLPQWFASTPVAAPPPIPIPMSKEFDNNDCIWYYGTLYVKEAVAVTKMNEKQSSQTAAVAAVAAAVAEMTAVVAEITAADPISNSHNDNDNDNDVDEDDETESVCSGSSSSSSKNNAFKHPRSIGKQNQLKYLKDGMLLRHTVHDECEWFATFDAATNRIIRTQDGVAFDTLRQFARLHCNEVLSTDSSSANVWSDPHFQYQDMDDDSWHPLANLKKK